MIESKALLARFTHLLHGSRVALSVADARLADLPLAAVNQPFVTLCGYPKSALVGRNCRLLQPNGGAGPVRTAMRSYLEHDLTKVGEFVVPNVQADGTPFLNLLYMAKLTHEGETVFVLGSQFRLSLERGRADLYDRAMREHIALASLALSDNEAVILNSARTIAHSVTAVAQARLSKEP